MVKQGSEIRDQGSAFSNLPLAFILKLRAFEWSSSPTRGVFLISDS